MAETANTSNSGSVDSSVGSVRIVYGDVKAVNQNGEERILDSASPVFADERIITGEDGSVSIVFDDGKTQLDLGKLSDVQIDADVYARLDDSEIEDSIAEVDQIQQALLDGTFDPTTQLEATAAGPAAGNDGAAGGGREFVEFVADAMEVTPDSGAETTGLGRDFLDPPTIIVEEEGDEVVAAESTTVTPVETAPEPTPVTPVEPTPEPGSELQADPDPTPDPDPGDDPGDGPDPKVFTDPNEELRVSEDAFFKGDDGLVASGNLLHNTENATSPVVSSISVMDKNGDYQDYAVGKDPVTVDVYQDGVKTGTLTVKQDGSYTYTLEGNANHSHPGKYGEDDDVTLEPVNYTVTDTATGQTDSSTLTLTIEDGAPKVEVLQNAILANESGNSVTGDISADYGADGKAIDEHGAQDIELLGADGESLVGKQVVDVNGNPLTSGGEKLVYASDGNGGVIAVTESSGEKVFTVGVTPPSEDGKTDASYTVTLVKPLDPRVVEKTQEIGKDDLTTVENGSATAELAGGVTMTIKGEDGNEEAATITVDENGRIGVDTKKENETSWQKEAGDSEANQLDSGEYVNIGFTKNDEPVAADVSLSLHMNKGESSPNVNVTLRYADGSFTTKSYTEDADIDCKGVTAVEISNEAGKSSSCNFGISATTRADEPQQLAYKAKITDGDEVVADDGSISSAGDSDVSETFTVTVDGDNNISGTDAAEVIAGSSKGDTISGGGGADVIDGGDGDDTISGGDGDDTISGGDGDDDISTGEGSDTVAQSEVDGGEVSDMDTDAGDAAVGDDEMNSLVGEPG